VPDHVVVRCTAASCSLRFPVPVGDPRHGQCPLCEAPTVDVMACPPPHAPPAPSQPDPAQTIGVLDNIRSALNVGTMLRGADGARLAHMHLCGLTPDGAHPKVTKTSLGAEQSVPWTWHSDAAKCVGELRNDGWTIWAVESTPDAVSLESLDSAPDRLALVVGNERAGVDPGVLEQADRVVYLPMAGAKTTLNVGVAFGIAAYGVRRLRHAAVASS
jgi:tRNA G18 (ribose-2'-O)-methylase SpoU